MKYSNNQATFLTALLACLTVLATTQSLEAQQVRSDYQIQSDFKATYKSINTSLDDVENVTVADSLIAEIRSLEIEYSDDEALLDKALYPETYDGVIENLKRRASSVQNRLTTIQSQDQQLEELTDQLTDNTRRLAQLNSRTDSIRTAMQQSVQSERQLSDQLRRYRQSLEQRDEFILSIIDSVLVTYRNIDIETLANMENATDRARISEGGNPLALIQTIADENVEFLNSNTTLSTGDYLRMNVVQKEFSMMWNRVGDKMTEIYSDNPQQVRSNIERSIGLWAEGVESNLWTSIQQSFEETGIELQELGDSRSFAVALNNYVDQGLAASSENGNRQTFQNYQNFTNFWNNQIKGSWGEFLTHGEILTTRQMASLDQKMNQWAGIAEPESNTFVYLFGVSLLAVVVLGVMLFREKSGDSQKRVKS